MCGNQGPESGALNALTLILAIADRDSITKD